MNGCEAVSIYESSDLLATEEEVRCAIRRIAGEMTLALQGCDPLLLCCMTGGMIFAGQLITQLHFPLQVDYVHATRYGHEIHGSLLEWKMKPSVAMRGKTVVLLDDILDEGVTLASVAEYCRSMGAKRVLMAVLIEKLHLRKVTPGMRADFFGLEIGDRFLFGYGLDIKGYWRNAPGIFAVKGR